MNKIQAVILAAGESSRFYPFNDLHKSMVKVLGKPILEHTINGLKKEDITQIVLVTGKNSAIKDYFGDGKKLGVSIDYVVQPKPLGMGNALLLAEKKLKGNFLLLNAHRIDVDKFVNSLLKKQLKDNIKAVLLVKQKENTQIHGVIKFEQDKVLDVVEKPKKGEEPSNLCVVGIYLLPYDFLRTLKDTPSEHYQLEKAITAYTKKENVSFAETKDELITLRYPWDILGIKNYLLKNIKNYVGKNVNIAKSAEISGEVFIGDNVSIMEKAVIKGPAFIGNNVFIGNNAILRGGVDIEENAVVGANMEIKNSILMQDSTTHSGYIGDSVIGENCKIAAGFFTANVRLDRQFVKVFVKGEKIDTGLKFFGAIIGSNADIGIRASTMPGVIIGRNVTIGPSTVVMENIEDDTKYYTKFAGIVSKKNILRQAQDLQKPVVLFDIDYTLFDTGRFKDSQLQDYNIYQEVMGVLMQLSSLASLGIFSKGENEFQKTKLKKTGMVKFFKENNIHIFDDKDANLINVLEKYNDSRLFLIDDKLGILYSAKKHTSQIFTIWVKRGPYAQKQGKIPGFKPDAEVENLEEVISIIGKKI